MAKEKLLVTPQQDVFGNEYMNLGEIQPNQGRWDSYLIAAGALANSYPLFVTPEGSQGSGFARNKTERETNMPIGGQLENTVNGSVSVIYITATATGAGRLNAATHDYIMTFLEDSILEVRVNDGEVVGPRPLVRYGGYGIGGFVSQAAAGDISIASTGATNKMADYRLRIPIGLPSNTGFSVIIRPNTNNAYLQTVPTGADFVLTCYLIGKFVAIAVA